MTKSTTIQYPTSKKVDHIDIYHGHSVNDPYRWLEDEVSPDTEAWINDQNRVSREYLDGLPRRDEIRSRVRNLFDYSRYSKPLRRGDHYYYSKHSGLENHAVWYRQCTFDEEPEVIIDPNTLSEDGTAAITMVTISPDGRYFSYMLTQGGSDWQTIKVMDMETGEELPDTITWVKMSNIAWTHDNQGFFYSRYPEPESTQVYSQTNLGHALYYHVLGQPQEQDVLIFQPEKPEVRISGLVNDDGRYLLLSSSEIYPHNRLDVIDLNSPEEPDLTGTSQWLIGDHEAEYRCLGNDDNQFYIQTNVHAPRNRIVGITLGDTQQGSLRTIIPEADDTITNATLVGDNFIVTYLHNAYNRVLIYDIDGAFQKKLPIDHIGSIHGMNAPRDSTEVFYVFTSFLTPSVIRRYDVETGEDTLLRASEAPFDSSDYVTRQLWFESYDGTKVPMFVTYKKGMKLDGNNPALLYGYGGFNISLTPFFSADIPFWLENGGIYVVANIRGGGEFGKEWYHAGTKERKQNVFDDFMSAAEFLCTNGYTSSDKLVIQGGSNGGLLIGAVISQRPELAAVAIPEVGVLDMLRYHKFTIGASWAHDYGTSDDPDEFQTLFAYSPLHNLREGTRYPATLIVTGDHDDRVVPAHSYKFAARLQECHAGSKPVLIRIARQGGHGGATPLSMVIDEMSDIFAFTMHQLDM